MKKKSVITYGAFLTSALNIWLLLLFSGCSQFNPNGVAQLSTNEQSATASFSISIGEIGHLAKRKSIDLQHIVLTLNCSDEDTIRDTTNLSGTGGSELEVVIGGLAAPKQWWVAVASYDRNDSCIHSGSTTFTTVPADTVDIELDLAAKFSMLRVSFNGIPDSALSLSVSLDGAIDLDTTLAVAGSVDTAVLAFDYLSADTDGTDHVFSMRVRGIYYGINTILYSADTILSVVSGVDTDYAVTLKWVGPYINNPPVFTSQPADMLDSVFAGSVYLDTVKVSDPDGDDVTLILEGTALDDSIIELPTEPADIGTHTLRLIAHDGNGGYDTLEWTIRILEPPVSNHTPVFSSQPADMRSTIYVDSTYCDTVHATDADDDALTFTILQTISGMQINDSIITWVPTEDNTGANAISVVADDGNGGKDTLAWNVQVSTPTQYPLIPFDSLITGEISPAIEVDRYQFQGTAGDKISLRLAKESSLRSIVSIIDASNNVIVSNDDGYGGTNLIDTVSLTASGTYMVRIESYQGGTDGAYSFILYSWNKQWAESPALEYEQVYTESVDPAIEVQTYLFQVTAGDKVSLRLAKESSLRSVVSIIDASNNVIVSNDDGYGGTNLIDTVTIPASGTYMVRIESYNGSTSGTYDFIVYND